jgi:hypothetical protein
LFGEIFALEDHPSFGKVVRVRLPDGREVDCRAMFAGAYGTNGTFRPLPDSGTALVFLPGGSTASASAIVGIQTDGVPSDYNGSKTVTYGLEERRATEGATSDGVLVRALLDDLATLVQAVQGLLTAITGTVIVPNDGGAAIKAAVSLAATTSLTANLATVLTNLNTSKAGSGTAPHCSGVLRAQAGG